MPSKISNLENVHIFGKNSQELGLCKNHRKGLCKAITPALGALVETSFFQTQFQDFLPEPGKEVQLKISLTKKGIVVQGQQQIRKTIDFKALKENEAKEFNAAILKTVNRIYQDHLGESRRRKKTQSQAPRQKKRKQNVASVEIQSTKVNTEEASRSAISSEDHQRLIELSEKLSDTSLSGSTHFPPDLKEEFLKLSEKIRHEIYYHTYLIRPSVIPDYFPVGQHLFDETDQYPMHNLSRSHAIRQLLLHSLATHFEKKRFKRLPEEDQNQIRIQFQYEKDWRNACYRMALLRLHDYHSHQAQQLIEAVEGYVQDLHKIKKPDISPAFA